MDRQAFKQAFFDGKVFDAYRWFGAHLEGDTAVFRTFAPNAARITVTGACNGWNETELTQDGRSGFWEGRCTGAAAGQFYKYRIYGRDGTVTEHCDPYGRAMELRPGCCSILTAPEGYSFSDEDWMQARTAAPDAPLNIYELHPGSWRRSPADENGWYRYDELAGLLIPYLTENGFYARRVSAPVRAPVRRLVGLPEHGLFRPNRALRHTRSAQGVDRPPASGGHRRDPGLCARAFRGGQLRPRALRRHPALRIPAYRRGRERVGQLQLHPLAARGAVLSAIRGRLLADRIPLRRPAHGRGQPPDLLAGRPRARGSTATRSPSCGT